MYSAAKNTYKIWRILLTLVVIHYKVLDFNAKDTITDMTREEAKHVIFEYIEVFYNRIRIHSANNYMSPVEFEKIQNVA